MTEAETFRYKNVLGATPVKLYRDRNRLIVNGEIKLFDMNGILLRKGNSELSLEGLGKGMFVAKSGTNVMKVNIR